MRLLLMTLKAYLDGGKTYKVTLPAPIPINNFWSFMVYSGQHRSMLETDQKLAGLDSNSPSIKQTMMNLIRFGSGQRRRKGTRAIGFKRSPEKATVSCYDSMAHWNRGSTKPGNRVILNLWSSHPPLRRAYRWHANASDKPWKAPWILYQLIC
jgi:hypothetical protein